MSSMGPVRSKDVKGAQAQLVEAALRLMSEGEVSLPENDDDMMSDMPSRSAIQARCRECDSRHIDCDRHELAAQIIRLQQIKRY